MRGNRNRKGRGNAHANKCASPRCAKKQNRHRRCTRKTKYQWRQPQHTPNTNPHNARCFSVLVECCKAHLWSRRVGKHRGAQHHFSTVMALGAPANWVASIRWSARCTLSRPGIKVHGRAPVSTGNARERPVRHGDDAQKKHAKKPLRPISSCRPTG